MSYFDEYGDPRELNPFYEAIELALKKNSIATASEILNKAKSSFPRLPSEFTKDGDYKEIEITDDLPF